MEYLMAFLVGGAICALAQLVMDAGKILPAYVMVLFVSLGAIASGFGLYGWLIAIGNAGATIPLPNFGHALVQGILEDSAKRGWLALLSGGLRATAMPLTMSIIAGYLFALLFTPHGKSNG